LVGEEGVKGEVAVDKETSPVMGEVAAGSDDVPEVVEGAAVWACGVVRGGGVVAEGVVPLK
jgi:hypothetical protein